MEMIINVIHSDSGKSHNYGEASEKNRNEASNVMTTVDLDKVAEMMPSAKPMLSMVPSWGSAGDTGKPTAALPHTGYLLGTLSLQNPESLKKGWIGIRQRNSALV